MKDFKDVSRRRPKRKDRACFCKDSNTYAKKCCDGLLWSQGIGSISIAPTIIYKWGETTSKNWGQETPDNWG